jgi:small subunit ribosomal protein S4
MPRRRDVSAQLVKDHLEQTKGRTVPAWLEVRPEALEGRVIGLPTREDVSVPVEEQLIIEFCSK